MTYFYAAGEDKDGNMLITSYKKQDQAEKYRKGATFSEGLRYLDTDRSTVTAMDTGLLLRTIIARKDAGGKMEGDFIVWARLNGEWFQTEFRYSTYAAANTAVKGALIQLYDACAVIENDE